MRIVKKVFGFIFYGGFALAMTLLFIACCLHLGDADGSYFLGVILLTVTTLIALLSSTFGIVALAKGKHDNIASACGLAALALIGFVYLFLGFLAFYFFDEENPALFIISIPYLIMLICALCLTGEKTKKARKALALISIILTIAIIIAWFPLQAGEMKAFDIVVAVFIMLSCIMGIPYYAMFNNKEKEKLTKEQKEAAKAERKAQKAAEKAERDAKPEVVKESKTKKAVKHIVDVKEAKDASTISKSLEELKKLYDQGILTEEEYQEKRNKYVEKL